MLRLLCHITAFGTLIGYIAVITYLLWGIVHLLWTVLATIGESLKAKLSAVQVDSPTKSPTQRSQ